MPDVTQNFTSNPVRFLQRTPCFCRAEFLGVHTLRARIEGSEDGSYAQILPAAHNEYGVPFHILGWKDNSVSTGYLNSSADYFFTGPLSGCTFAVDKNWYVPHVLHVNEKLPTGRANPQGMMTTVNWEMMLDTSFWTDNTNITIVESHNRPESDTYNIFGVRGYLGWTFYQQVTYTRGQEDMRVTGLYKLDTAF